jgi:hypothetical protein
MKSDTTGTSEGCDNICIYIYILTSFFKNQKSDTTNNSEGEDGVFVKGTIIRK